MKLSFYNCPKPERFREDILPETPGFISHVPYFALIKGLASEYRDYKNLLVVGHGGSITSFAGIYSALQRKSTKRAYFLSTTDPDYISRLREELPPAQTLVLAISKSGETTTQIEALTQFLDYPLLFVTGDDSPLAKIAAETGAKTISHPPVGGRYSGLTETGLVPAALCGFDVEALFRGGHALHAQFRDNNAAWESASIFYQLEEQGYVDVFMPFYSHSLFSMGNLVVQLCHESFGKDSKGQTYFAHEAPESQHHTNQRFLGGRKNIAGWFTAVESFSSDLKIGLTDKVKTISLKQGSLETLEGLTLSQSMAAEFSGTLQDAINLKIPTASMILETLDEETVGEYMAFWQMYAVYSSVLRNVNPFDQPAVEASKALSFQKRQNP